MKTRNIKRIVVESGTEPCDVDVNMLHETLLALPAEIYLKLFQMMKAKIDSNAVEVPVVSLDREQENWLNNFWVDAVKQNSACIEGKNGRGKE